MSTLCSETADCIGENQQAETKYNILYGNVKLLFFNKRDLGQLELRMNKINTKVLNRVDDIPETSSQKAHSWANTYCPVIHPHYKWCMLSCFFHLMFFIIVIHQVRRMKISQTIKRHIEEENDA